ncbi:MAG: hypothetical protein U0572_13990 [Phycisphaerales bacterium]
MTRSSEPNPVERGDARPASVPTAEGLGCRVCGQALAGLPRDGACPECGTPIERSLRGNWLEYASPEYVASLRRGAWLVIVGLAATLLWFVATPLTLELAVRPGHLSMTAGMLLIQIMDVAATTVSLVGWWLFTAPDPAMRDADADVRARVALRGLLFFVAIATLLGLVVLLVPGLGQTGLRTIIGEISITPNTKFTPTLLGGLSIRLLLLAAKLVAFFLGLVYVRELAARMPDARLRRLAHRLLWLVPLLSTVGILACGLGPFIAFGLYVWMMVKALRGLHAVQMRMNGGVTVAPVH